MTRFVYSNLREILAALVAAMGVAGTLVAAQSETATKQLVELDRKTASKLLLRQVAPEYPSIARVNYIRGQVRMLITVGPSGKVRVAHVVQGHPFLAASSLEAIRRWVYRPLVTASGPTEFQTMVNVNFTLRSIKVDRLPPDPDQDLTRQVRPPEAPDRPDAAASADCVRMRVLVNDGGQVIDVTPLGGRPALFWAARHRIDSWKFRPAHWGNLKVPWYVDVTVPVNGAEPGENKSRPLGMAPIGG